MKWMYNDQIVEDKELKIPVSDHGFLYGVGLFETFRVYNGVPFLFKEHMDRLQAGLHLIGIKHFIDHKTMNNQLRILLEQNSINNAYVRLTITGGEGQLGLPTKEYTNPSILWQLKPLEPLVEEADSKGGIILKTHRNQPETSVRLKSLNFLNNVLAKQEIMGINNVEGFFLTKEGYLAEGIVSNLFFVVGGVLYTPALETGILNGITRQFVLQLSNKNNIQVIEGFFSPDMLFMAEEVFVTNSIQEIVKINAINNIEISLKEQGLTDCLIKAYKAAIKIACF